jgi:RND family efflux transporter MFP subunit
MIKLVTIAFLIPGMVLAAGGCGWETRAADLDEPYLHLVKTHTVSMQPGYRVEREFAGEVEAVQSSRLGFEFPGQVEALFVDEGDSVGAGQLLARLDTRLLQSEREELSARRAELQAEWETARRNLERVERLQAEQLVSERERDDLAGRVQVLRASLQRVDAELQANGVRLDKSELRAPFDAGIAQRLIDVGVVVDAGMPVISLVQEDAREIRAGVPVRLAEILAPGDAVAVRVGDRQTSAEVAGLGPVVDPLTLSRTLRARVNEDWPPGQIAYLQIAVPVDGRGAWLPDSAVTEGVRGTWVVYAAVDAGDQRAGLEARSVVIHHVRGNELYVSGALEDGEQIVAAGLHRLAPGQLVRTDNATRMIADARPVR